MSGLDLTRLTNSQRPTGAWAAALLHALARDEAANRRRARLTEPNLATWKRFRGRLSSIDLVSIMFEDEAVVRRVPFEAGAVSDVLGLDRLPVDAVDAWLDALTELPLEASSADYVLGQARLLGLPTRMARSELHVVKPHHKVLELPGTGGQLAHHLASTQGDLTLQDNFVVACGTWQELTLAGIVGLELGAPHNEFVVRAEGAALRRADHPLRQRTFDFVVGIHPDKGGLFRIEEQLAIWFPNAKHLLV